MLDITENHVDKFRRIKNNFLEKTNVPEENIWKSRTNDQIWLNMIKQIIVVGGAAPANKLDKNDRLKNRISYEYLLGLKEDDVREKIHQTLLDAKARYASCDANKCKKTKALVHNFEVLKSKFPEGPKGLLEKLSEYQGEDSEKRRIKYIMDNFQYLKNKGARDFLMELGLVKNTIALDSRVKRVLVNCGIEIEDKTYDEIEMSVLDKICKPLNLSGVQFDRLIFQNYKEIIKMDLR